MHELFEMLDTLNIVDGLSADLHFRMLACSFFGGARYYRESVVPFVRRY